MLLRLFIYWRVNNKRVFVITARTLLCALCCTMGYSTLFAQDEGPVYKLASTNINNKQQFSVVFRYDATIDSVVWPIDSNILGINYKRLNLQGLPATDEVVCYMYYFTAKTKGPYVLPAGNIWSKGKAFPFTMNDTLHLNIQDTTSSISSLFERWLTPDSAKQQTSVKSFFDTSDIKPRKENLKQNLYVWADKESYLLNEKVRVVAEFKSRDIQNDFKLTLSNTNQKYLKLVSTSTNYNITNGKETQYTVYTYVATNSGKVFITANEMRIASQKASHKPIKIVIAKRL